MKKILIIVLVFGLFSCSTDNDENFDSNQNPSPNENSLENTNGTLLKSVKK